jgi:hypothetical protein
MDWGGFRFWAFFSYRKRRKSPMNMNIQEFLDRFESDRDGEKLQHVLIGSMEGIEEARRILHSVRYATLGLWSPVIPMPGTSLYMSVLTKYRRAD